MEKLVMISKWRQHKFHSGKYMLSSDMASRGIRLEGTVRSYSPDRLRTLLGFLP